MDLFIFLIPISDYDLTARDLIDKVIATWVSSYILQLKRYVFMPHFEVGNYLFTENMGKQIRCVGQKCHLIAKIYNFELG